MYETNRQAGDLHKIANMERDERKYWRDANAGRKSNMDGSIDRHY